jgi:hypothetical protein
MVESSVGRHSISVSVACPVPPALAVRPGQPMMLCYHQPSKTIELHDEIIKILSQQKIMVVQFSPARETVLRCPGLASSGGGAGLE